jgi:hypothetical protein
MTNKTISDLMNKVDELNELIAEHRRYESETLNNIIEVINQYKDGLGTSLGSIYKQAAANQLIEDFKKSPRFNEKRRKAKVWDKPI